jgi:hypothetical protein
VTRSQEYDKLRQDENDYKSRRHYSTKLRGDRNLRSDSMYTNDDPAKANEHAYGINLE